MKPTTFLNLAFLLFAFTTYLPLAFSQVSDVVRDTNGNQIFPGGRFYILPAIFGAAGGGVRLGKTGNSTCPVTVLQDYSEAVSGLPVRFEIQAEVSIGIIFTGTPLNIVFVEKPDCAESSKWVVVRSDDQFPGGGFVGIGGVEDHQGKQILDGSFSIQKQAGRSGYNLVFCPTITAPPGDCFNIGRYNDENGRRLILAKDDPYDVVFVDARATDSSSSI